MPRRIPKFRSFVGHKKEVDLLLHQLTGAKMYGEPFPPCLLSGPSGVGKTLLAKCLADEFGTQLTVVNGQICCVELANSLQDLKACDFFFVDEAHNLESKAQEALYQVIDERRVPLGDQSRRTGQETAYANLPPLTILLATDQPGKLLNALDKRMELQVSLTYYNKHEMRAIVDRLATDVNLLVSPQAANHLAKVSRGLPRKAKHLLQNLRRHFPDAEQRQLGISEMREFLRAFGIDSRGLGKLERKYLRLLRQTKSASLESLASTLGFDSDYVRRQIEPVLKRSGLITISSAGRRLTERGEHATKQTKATPSRKES